MIGLHCEVRKDQHRIIHPRYESWMKRHLPLKLRDRLFVYFHMQACTFVIALWESPVRKRRFQDVINLGHDLYSFDRGQALNFLLNLRDSKSGAEMATEMRAGYRSLETRMNDSQMEQREQRLHRQSTKLSLLVRSG